MYNSKPNGLIYNEASKSDPALNHTKLHAKFTHSHSDAPEKEKQLKDC